MKRSSGRFGLFSLDEFGQSEKEQAEISKLLDLIWV